jgi:hypothetical protein
MLGYGSFIGTGNSKKKDITMQYLGLDTTSLSDSQNPLIYGISINVNLLPIFAYQKIYFDFYSNSQWEKHLAYSYNVDYWDGKSSIEISADMIKMRYANYPKDYFLGVLPASQYGSVAVLPSSPVSGASSVSVVAYRPGVSPNGYSVVEASTNSVTDDDKIILHASRCLTRFCNSSSDVDIESYINKLYRLFLYVFKFFRNWHLPGFGCDLTSYTNRIMFIVKTGIEYEKEADYENLRSLYGLRSQYPELSDCMFVLPANGQESDVLQSVSGETVQLLEQLRYRSSTFCRDMIKHKKLNDANNIFNRMV